MTLMAEWSEKKNRWMGWLSDRKRNVKRYRKRWGMKTKHRDVNRVRGWTTSKKWVVRRRMYGFGVLMNGVWEMYGRMVRKGVRMIVERVGQMGDVGVRRRWAEKMGQLKVMIAILQGTWPYLGSEGV